jgi:hypothetical protein
VAYFNVPSGYFRGGTEENQTNLSPLQIWKSECPEHEARCSMHLLEDTEENQAKTQPV